MKKIDLHLHTISTPSDSYFEFSLDALSKYVASAKLDCIAITNHNTFDKTQYLKICEHLDILVLPGIEVDLEGGHILVICDPSELDEFTKKCELVNQDIPDAKTHIDFNRFVEIFGDLSNYILIPHIDKSPAINKQTLDKFGDFLDCGEVRSVKKFLYAMKQGSNLPPVLFSDLRAKDGLKQFPTRQTYVDLGELSFQSLKRTIGKRDKLFLSEFEGNSFFSILDGRVQISTGLNVILGQRSSGKSHTLDSILEGALDEEVKYIKQFELLEKSESDDESKFEEKLRNGRRSYIEDYLKEFKSVVEEVEHIDLDYSDKLIGNYLESLKTFAFNKNRHDSYSSTSMFNEERFKPTSTDSLTSLIKATQVLLDNEAYKEIVDKNIERKNLVNLLSELVNEYRLLYKVNKSKIFVNGIVKDIQAQLNVQSATTPIAEVDLYQSAIDRQKVRKFSKISDSLRQPADEIIEYVQGFQIIARKGKYSGAGELRAVNRNVGSFTDAYKSYFNPYQFLQTLKENDSVDSSDYYRFFSRIKYEVLNNNGYKVSGGERSEFRLLQSIKDAYKYDILLIDEPESSFDNIFLLNKVNKLIKDLSKQMPVVVVTHNSTVGASIEPDYLLYTKKEVTNGDVEYDIYSGYPNDKHLKNPKGEIHPNHTIQLNCLEAGIEPYKDRGKSYETLKN